MKRKARNADITSNAITVMGLDELAHVWMSVYSEIPRTIRTIELIKIVFRIDCCIRTLITKTQYGLGA
jgi:hypothetical protein